MQGLTGRAAANFVVSYLEGAARIEMRCQSDEVRKDAERNFVALDEVYGEKSSSSQLLRAFYERSQILSQKLSQNFLTDLWNYSIGFRDLRHEWSMTVTECYANN